MDKNQKLLISIIIVLIIIGGMAILWAINELNMSPPPPHHFLASLNYLENESTNETAIFSVLLVYPEKTDFNDVYILIWKNDNKIDNFTYDMIDVNLDGYFNTNDKINVTLTEGEFESGDRVVMLHKHIIRTASYEFD